MCHFITAAIDKNISLNELNTIAKKHQLSFTLCKNKYIIDQLGDESIYIQKMTHSCDCGTCLGYLRDKDFRIEEKDLLKMKKLNWSEGKIKRWMEEKESAYKKRAEKSEKSRKSAEMEASNWIEFIQTLFEKTSIRHFNLLLHWYKSGPEMEEINLKQNKSIHWKELNENDFLNMEEDHFFEVHC